MPWFWLTLQGSWIGAVKWSCDLANPSCQASNYAFVAELTVVWTNHSRMKNCWQPLACFLNVMTSERSDFSFENNSGGGERGQHWCCCRINFIWTGEYFSWKEEQRRALKDFLDRKDAFALLLQDFDLLTGSTGGSVLQLLMWLFEVCPVINGDRQLFCRITCKLFFENAHPFSKQFLRATSQMVLCNKPSGASCWGPVTSTDYWRLNYFPLRWVVSQNRCRTLI